MNSICHQKQFKLSRLFTLCFAASVAIGTALPASAATLGHSRLVSGVGQALRIHIPIKQITANELASLNISPAPQQQWQQSGLTPPVDLSSLSIGLIDGPSPGSHVVVVSSQQVFDKQIADLLLDVKTDSGSQAYQVSILAQNDATVIQAPSAAATPVSLSQSRAAASVTSTQGDSVATGKNIVVKPGDNMFAIAKRNSVANVSVYQMMIALQRANPNAFINGNINLVKAGATLTMPDSNAISAISDSQARKIFHQQVLAFKKGFSVSDNQNLISSNDDNSGVQTITESVDAATPESTTTTTPAQDENVLIPADAVIQDATKDDQTSPDEGKSTSIDVANTPLDTENITPAAQVEQDTDSPENAESDANEKNDNQTNDSAAANTTTQNNSADELKLSAMINDAAQGIANSVSGAALAAENSDAIQDAKVAADKAVEYTKEKISQLEENVKNLNEALTAQGSAASEAIIEGALELQKALSDDDESDAASNADSTRPSTGSGVTGADFNASGSDTGSASSDASTTGSASDSGSGTDSSSSGSDGGSSDSDSSTSTDSDTTSSSSASTSSSTSNSSTAGGITTSSSASTSSTAATTTNASNNLITPTDKPKAWFKKYFLALAGGLIGFIILIIVWVLRRSYVMDTGSSAAVTPEMVQDKLNQINLNLDEPSIRDDNK